MRKMVEERHWEVTEIEKPRFNSLPLTKLLKNPFTPAFQKTGPDVCCR